MKKQQNVTTVYDWRLGKEITKALESIKFNFNFKYIKEILLKYATELDINIINIDNLTKYYYNKGIPKGKLRTGFGNFFEFTKSKSKELYWIKRGWNIEEAKIKIIEFLNNHANYKKRLLYFGYNEEEADKIYKESFKNGVKTLKNRLDYEEIKDKRNLHNINNYLKRINKKTGLLYTLDEAKISYSLQQSNAGKMSAKNKTKDKFNTRIEYYLVKGLNQIDAEKTLFERQIQNGLNYYINKYGLEEGTKKYNIRIKEYGRKIKEYRKNHPEKWATSGKRYSDSSKRFFDSIIKEIPNLEKFKIYYAESEYFLWDKKNHKIYFYDFYIKELNLMIEYHGLVWHPKERTQFGWQQVYTKESSEIIYDKDKFKEQLAYSYGIDIISIFEDELINKRKQITDELYTRIQSYTNNQ